MKVYIDEGHKQYATDKQWKYALAYMEHGSWAAVARIFGVDEGVIRKSVKRLYKRAAMKGYAPDCGPHWNNKIPEPFMMHGLSHYDEETKTWVKTSIERQKQLEIMQSMVDSLLTDNVTPRMLSKQELEYKSDEYYDIIPWLNIGDAHLGMLACAEEVGNDFDIKIASRELLTAFKYLIDQMPQTERVVINDIGDFTHYENISGVTDHSGHLLDCDTRYFKMIDVYVIVMKSLIDMAAKKFEKIDLIINQGNHSRTNDMVMASALRHLYSLDGRLNVLENSSVFIPYRMGNTFVMVHHGDKCKPDKLSDVMCFDFPHDYGEATFRYIDTGHVHHGNKTVKENRGIIHESFNNLTPADKYAHEGGWRSKATMTYIKRSKTYGEIGRETMPREQVLDMLKGASPGTSIANSRRKVHTV